MALTVLLPQDSANNPYLGLWDVANARWALWRGTNGALDGPGSAARADLATALYGPDGNPLLPTAAAIGDTDANPTTTSTASRATGWNGAAWERLKSGGGQLQVRLADISGNGLVSIPASADAMMLGSDDSLLVTAAGMAFNGATWDRLRTVASSGPGLGALAVGQVPSATLYDGTLAATTAAQALAASQACSEVLVTNDPTSSSDILVGNSASQHTRVQPGMGVSVPANNLNLIYVKAVAGTATANYLARSY